MGKRVGALMNGSQYARMLHEKQINAHDLQSSLEKFRKCSGEIVRRPGPLGSSDSHGHMWYCFCNNCEHSMKGHKSFNSDMALFQHLQAMGFNVETVY